MEERLRDISGGKGPFAHILGKGNNGESYYQFSPGKAADADIAEKSDKLIRKIMTAQKEYIGAFDYVSRLRSEKKLVSERLTAHRDLLRLRKNNLEEEQNTLRRGQMTAHSTPAGAEEIIDTLRGEYPNLHDIRGANIVGGKIVDMSPEVGHITYYDSAVPLGMTSESFSRKYRFGRPHK